MRICILRSNPIKPDSRVEKEAACLQEAGHFVKIICWDRDEDYDFSESTINCLGQDIEIVRFGIKASFGEGFKNLSQFLKFQFRLRDWLSKHHNEYDAVHACDFDTAFSTYWIARKYKKKFILDLFDMLSVNGDTLKYKILRKLEFFLINHADATIICTEKRRTQIEGTNPKKLVVIHNTLLDLVLKKKVCVNEDNPIKVCYVGILQDYRLLDKIPQFFIEHPEIEFHVGGFGKLETLYTELASTYPNIKFYGRIPYDQTLELENSCDIMLAVYELIGNNYCAAPNKFYEGLMLGKPLVMVKGTGMSEVVERLDCGAIIEYNLESFSNGILSLIARRKEWHRMKESMRAAYNDEFSWDEMKIRLVNLYKELSD